MQKFLEFFLPPHLQKCQKIPAKPGPRIQFQKNGGVNEITRS